MLTRKIRKYIRANSEKSYFYLKSWDNPICGRLFWKQSTDVDFHPLDYVNVQEHKCELPIVLSTWCEELNRKIDITVFLKLPMVTTHKFKSMMKKCIFSFEIHKGVAKTIAHDPFTMKAVHEIPVGEWFRYERI